MTQTHKVLLEILIDLGAALIGLAIGVLYLQIFRNGLSLPLESADGLMLILSAFIGLLLSSVFDKFIDRSSRT